MEAHRYMGTGAGVCTVWRGRTVSFWTECKQYLPEFKKKTGSL